VRALARDRSRAAELDERGAEVVEADVLRPETLPEALEGVEVAYYLVHSMGRGGSGDFSARDREAAGNFGAAATSAIPVLTSLLQDTNEYPRTRAVEVLLQIQAARERRDQVPIRP